MDFRRRSWPEKPEAQMREDITYDLRVFDEADDVYDLPTDIN